MKYSIGKCLFVVLAILAIADANAQRTGRRRNNTTPSANNGGQEQQTNIFQ